MHPERWTEIDNLLQSALELPTTEREDFLRDACADDKELEREVRSLLAAEKEAGSFLLSPAIDLAARAIAAKRAATGAENTSGRTLPAQIGRYRVLRVLGEGGMGVVYEAVQEHPHRTVALKVVKPGLESSLLRRFEHESQALARLQHPGIAQIFEAGVADTGFGPQPYFAMEYIYGQPLGKYTETHFLNVRGRLGLMGKICHAVEHAHQRGLIHRDLKPANILVDETGQPKILDFGVARVRDSEAQVTRQTNVGQLVGTLEYMSPEQVLADPMEIDARSDVYALGMILYEMLAGHRPYKLSERLHEAVQTIREEDPIPLSSVNRDYRGDIETIVAKALEKDRARRYASAAALAADIERYLADQPIGARPPSARYQIGKFARRHKTLVAGVTGVFIVLTAGVSVSTREAMRANRAEKMALIERDRALRAQQMADSERGRAEQERNRAEQERDRAIEESRRADTESATAKAVNDFLQNDILAQAGASAQAASDSSPDPDLKVRTALDRAAARIAGKFSSQPTVEASIRETIGKTYHDLGLPPQAEEQFARALDLRRRISGPQDSATLDNMNGLATVLIKEGKTEPAEVLLNEVLGTEGALGRLGQPATMNAMNLLALIADGQGNYTRAEALWSSILQARLRGSRTPDLDTGGIMTNLAVAYSNEGKYAQAEGVYQRAADEKRRLLGPDHPSTLLSMNGLGVVYRYEGKYAQAEAQLSSVLNAKRRTRGDLHPETVATMQSLAMVYDAEGRYQEAESLLEQAYTISWQGGAAYTARFAILANLAAVKLKRREYAEVESLLGSVVKTLPEDWRRFYMENMLGASLAGLGRYSEAEPLMINGYQGLMQHQSSIPVGSRTVLEQSRNRILQLYTAWGEPDKAAEWSRPPH